MTISNNVIQSVIPSPEKSYFRLEFSLPSDQLGKQLRIAMTIHHRSEHSYGNAWMIGPDGKTVRTIPEIKFQGPPEESLLFSVLGNLEISIASRFGSLGPVGDLYLSYFNAEIQSLMEKRANGVLDSPRLTPLQKAEKIYYLIVKMGMYAKYSWVKAIYKFVAEAGRKSLLDAGLCEAALYHHQIQAQGKKYP